MSLLSRLRSVFLQRLTPARLLKTFDRDQSVLAQQFFEKARTAGVPRGLRWVHCEWLPTLSLLRDKSTSQICLLVGVNISFDAIEGGDMENVAAVSLIRYACAVFHLANEGWQTSGRALFNMNPSEAADKLGASYEPIT